MKALCVRTVTLDPSLNLKRGVGEDRVGHSRDMARREEEGQNTEFGMWGNGILSIFSLNWITLDHLTVSTTPWVVNCASEEQRCLDGSNS